MSNSLEIKCPKCGAVQLQANETTINCSACGNMFLPSDARVEINNKLSETTAEGPLSDFDKKIIALAKAGNILQAVKFVKDTKDWGLKESKDYVDDLCLKNESRINSDTNISLPASDLDKKIIELAKAGNKLEAVKFLKDTKNLGLKESKDYVDELCRKNGIEVKSGCFIATACYGDYNSPEVVALRNYRDHVLMRTVYGRIFVELYYFFSPPIAVFISKSELLKTFIRNKILSPITRRIRKD